MSDLTRWRKFLIRISGETLTAQCNRALKTKFQPHLLTDEERYRNEFNPLVVESTLESDQ